MQDFLIYQMVIGIIGIILSVILMALADAYSDGAKFATIALICMVFLFLSAIVTLGIFRIIGA